MRQVNLYQPWSLSLDHALTKEELDTEARTYAAHMIEFHDTMSRIKFQDIATPLGKRFHYPVGSRRRKETVTALRSAERNLDAVWDRIDAVFIQHHGKTLHRLLRRYLPVERELQRTAEWVEPTKSHM
jgi:hypothetical protein